MGFPMAPGGERDRPEGQRGGREEAKDGGLALKQASGHHYRGAIVLYLLTLFL